MSDRANITVTSLAKQADSRPGSQVIGNVYRSSNNLPFLHSHRAPKKIFSLQFQ